MKTTRLIFALVLSLAGVRAAAAQSVPSDLAGWGLTTWGMSRQEVLEALPESARPARAGETGDLVVEDVRIGGTPYEARLFVGPHGLERVFLSAARRDATPAIRRRLERALSAELGGGRLASRRPEDLEVRWAFPSTDVRLLYSRLSTPDVNWQGLFVVFSRADVRRAPADAFQSVSR